MCCSATLRLATTLSVVCISCWDPKGCSAESISFVIFVNSLTFVDVQSCTEGIQRRGVQAKR